jgi:hypothetical protein
VASRGYWLFRPLWIKSSFDRLEPARRHWATEEGVGQTNHIGYVVRPEADNPPQELERLNALHDDGPKNQVLQRLRHWLQSHDLDAVIWRDSSANSFEHQTSEEAKQWVNNRLQACAPDDPEAMYIRKVPIQIWTVIRAHVGLQFNWVGLDWGPPRRITTADDLRFIDWQECRKTIGRLDTILADLRKYGFSIIVSLLTAGAFLNFLGFLGSAGTVPSPDARAAVFLTVMVLVAALFSVDSYYQVLLSGAVERALDLEAQTRSPIRVTKYLSVNAFESRIGFVILVLYIVLLAMAEGLGLFTADGLHLATGWWPPTLAVGPRVIWWIVILIVIGFIIWRGLKVVAREEIPHWGLLPSTIFFWVAREKITHWAVLPATVVNVLATLTISLSILLTPKAPLGLRHGIVVAGAILALSIQLYWLYCTCRSGLHSQRRDRDWPEGDKKVAAP